MCVTLSGISLSEDEVDVSSESDILEDLMNQPTEDGQMHASKVPYNADINKYISGNLFYHASLLYIDNIAVLWPA
jgi:hypothetical protein